MSIKDYDDLCILLKNQVKENYITVEECYEYLRKPLVWISEHKKNHPDIHCVTLLDGAYGTAVEALSLLSLGLVRPAVLSLRSFYEINLMYLYYRDHPVEWKAVSEYRLQAKLPGEIKKYIHQMYSEAGSRSSELLKNKHRKYDDCYEVLSAVAHSRALNSILTANNPKEIIASHESIKQCNDVFLAVAEAVFDMHLLVFDGGWLALPKEVQAEIQKRFGEKKFRNLLSL
ncbi:hypothetical protein L6172_00785 [Thalassospiraceae bacterium SW-3-3]|nr:hypothetical protein L6172_00785 [Thalassospiraceae bacterium SW-3-3]